MTALLKVTDLKKAYGAIQAVGGVSFEVQPGEIFGVIGPNGSGKTTLFNSMLGQITPNAGTIELKGEDVTHCGPLELSRRRRASSMSPCCRACATSWPCSVSARAPSAK